MSRSNPAAEYCWLLFWLLVIGAAQVFVSTIRAIGVVTLLVIILIVGRAFLRVLGWLP